MKLLVAGSRSISGFDISDYIPDNTDMIITGGANGIDRIAEEYADRHGLSKLILRPKYKIYGRGAPLIRNKEMADLADEILIIWDGRSNGSKFTLEYCKSIGKSVTLINLANITN